MQSQKQQNDLCSFPFNITVIQVYTLNSNAEEAEVDWFYEDLQDILELTLKKDVLCRLLDSSHPDWRVMVPHCGFDLHFSDNE